MVLLHRVNLQLTSPCQMVLSGAVIEISLIKVSDVSGGVGWFFCTNLDAKDFYENLDKDKHCEAQRRPIVISGSFTACGLSELRNWNKGDGISAWLFWCCMTSSYEFCRLYACYISNTLFKLQASADGNLEKAKISGVATPILFSRLATALWPLTAVLYLFLLPNSITFHHWELQAADPGPRDICVYFDTAAWVHFNGWLLFWLVDDANRWEKNETGIITRETG